MIPMILEPGPSIFCPHFAVENNCSFHWNMSVIVIFTFLPIYYQLWPHFPKKNALTLAFPKIFARARPMKHCK